MFPLPDRAGLATRPPEANPHATRRRIWVVCGLLVLAVGLVFGQTVTCDFVNWDDPQYVYENAHVRRGMSIEGVVWAFISRDASNWHPLTWMSHMLDCQAYGLWAGGHHLTNVLIHAATSVGLFLVLRRMTGRLWPSALVAAVFAIHPLRVESVAWVAERKDLLAGLFFVLTIWAYVEYVGRPFSALRYSLVVACFALGLMAKPMLVTLPAVLLLLDYWPLRRLGTSDGVHGLRPAFRALVEKLPLLAMAGMSSAVTLWAQQNALTTMEHLPLSQRLANAALAYAAYLGKFVWPVHLIVFYPMPPHGWPIWMVVAACGILAGISGAVVLVRRSHPYLLVGWFWYLGMLVPVIGIVQVGTQSLADRYTYLPQIGLGIALVWGGAEFLRGESSRRWLACVAVGGALAGLMGCAWRQTACWRSSETLWTQALACTANNDVAHCNFGRALFHLGRIPESIEHSREALRLNPDRFEAHNNLGLAFFALGRVDEATEQYRQALRIKSDDVGAMNNLGNALTRLGRPAEGIECFERALRFDPESVAVHSNLANALTKAGRNSEAIEHCQAAVHFKPDCPQAYYNWGNALFDSGADGGSRRSIRTCVAVPTRFHRGPLQRGALSHENRPADRGGRSLSARFAAGGSGRAENDGSDRACPTATTGCRWPLSGYTGMTLEFLGDQRSLPAPLPKQERGAILAQPLSNLTHSHPAPPVVNLGSARYNERFARSPATPLFWWGAWSSRRTTWQRIRRTSRRHRRSRVPSPRQLHLRGGCY